MGYESCYSSTVERKAVNFQILVQFQVTTNDSVNPAPIVEVGVYSSILRAFFFMNNLLLDVLAFGAVLSGILVITAKNPVISVLFLISVFINVAGYLVLLGVAYLGLAYLIIYVGAIAILFLFVIMMLNLRLVELIDTGQEYTQTFH